MELKLHNMDLEGKLKNSPLLSDDQKEWLRIADELFAQCPPTTYIKEIEETMDTIIYLNGTSSSTEYKDPVAISRMYYMLKCMRGAFRKMQKLNSVND